MTLGNMRANGVRSLAVSCHLMPPSGGAERGPVARSRASQRSARAWSAPGAASSRPNLQEQPARLSGPGTAPWVIGATAAGKGTRPG
jgi:hypothetical protein